jgi:hypothetical protein
MQERERERERDLAALHNMTFETIQPAFVLYCLVFLWCRYEARFVALYSCFVIRSEMEGEQAGFYVSYMSVPYS